MVTLYKGRWDCIILSFLILILLLLFKRLIVITSNLQKLKYYNFLFHKSHKNLSPKLFLKSTYPKYLNSILTSLAPKWLLDYVVKIQLKHLICHSFYQILYEKQNQLQNILFTLPDLVVISVLCNHFNFNFYMQEKKKSKCILIYIIPI